MSSTIKCDLCGNPIEGKRIVPTLARYGDYEPHPSYISQARTDEIPNERNFPQEKNDLPGFVLGRKGKLEGEVMRLWIRWRDDEDYCEQCVENAVVKTAERIRSYRLGNTPGTETA